MLAIHKSALTPAQIQSNYKVGVGQKFYMLFGVSELTGYAKSYIVFEVQQFDSYSYLFNKPFFLSLDPNVKPNQLAIEGLRIGVNGRESLLGQSFAGLKTTLNEADYQPKTGAPLSRLGTLVALEKGQQEDKFFLTFDRLGSHTSVRTPEALPPVPASVDKAKTSDIGLRTFDQINASLSALTGVPTASVAATFEQVKQQLPSVPAAEGFLAAHQMGITQLAVKYCNVLATTPVYRLALFPALEVNQNPLSPSSRSYVVSQLMGALLSQPLSENAQQPLSHQPNAAEINSALDPLFTQLAGCAEDCTVKTLTAACAATLGSAVMLLH